jgi:hypothetical protein
MGSQVSSPPHVSKFQHEGKVPTSEPQETIKVWFISIEVRFGLFYAKNLEIGVITLFKLIRLLREIDKILWSIPIFIPMWEYM